jgi:hypothetical protein
MEITSRNINEENTACDRKTSPLGLLAFSNLEAE